MEFKVVVNQWVDIHGDKKSWPEKLVAEFDCIEGAVDFVKTMFDNCDNISIEITKDGEEE